MDILSGEQRSSLSSPEATGSHPDSSVLSPPPEQDQRRGGGRPNRGHEQRGAGAGFHRGSRGGRGVYQPRGMGGGRYPGNRNEGANAVGPAGHHQPARRHPKKETLKFDNDYDFEQANEQFQEFCSKFEVFKFSFSAVG